MISSINDILNSAGLSTNRQYLKDVFNNINSDSFTNIVLSFVAADINIDIKTKLDQNKKTDAWIGLCKKIVNPLISCAFDKRADYDRLHILPFCCKVNNCSGQTYGINIYDSNNRILTIIYADSSANNISSLYTTDTISPVITGAWLSDIKPALKTLNVTGLNLIKQPQQEPTKKSISVLSTYYRGNTITINDLVDYIDRIKNIYEKNISI